MTAVARTCAGRDWTVAVIGCGNIGSRHLQALARLPGAARVVGVDPEEASLARAALRVAEIGPSPVAFSFATGQEALPDRIDVAIVATGAAGRRAAIERLLEERQVGALLLKKFLFQHERDYDAIGQLFEARALPAWVNLPRRAYPAYRALAGRLRGTGPIGLSVTLGAAAGLATNAIHFVDLFAFLAGGTEGLRLCGAQMRPIAGGSRHAGAVELGGVLQGRLADGSSLTVRRDAGSEAPVTVHVVGRPCVATIIETAGAAMLAEAAAAPGQPAWAPRPVPFEILRQSDLTDRVVAGIVETGSCELPRYAESARLHLACLAACREALAPMLARDAPCPIT